jgi:Uma2 family endonuclease
LSTLDAGTDPATIQANLRHLPPPYLLRKYDASVEDFEHIADEDLRCEFIDGVLIVHSPASFQHEARLTFLTILVGSFVASKRIGWVLGPNAVVQLGERRLCPDLSILKTEHADRIQNERVVGAMDLVVEMLSRSTRDYDLLEKRNLYRDGRIPEIWLLDAERKEAHVDFLGDEEYQSETVKTGRIHSRVLPGLSVDVTWLWSDPLPNPLDCLSTAS